MNADREAMACQFEEWLKRNPDSTMETWLKRKVNSTLLTMIRSGRIIHHGNGRLSLVKDQTQ